MSASRLDNVKSYRGQVMIDINRAEAILIGMAESCALFS